MTILKPYPAYKDSSVGWLGEVPEHWDVLPNRALFKEVIDKGHAEEQMLSVTIRRGVITQDDLLEDSSKKDASNIDKSSYKRVMPGDLAYNKMRAWQGALGVSEHQGIVSPAYIVMRPTQDQDTRFLHYLFRTPAFATEAERWSYGITSDQWSLRSEHFKQIYSLNPPLDEQRAIAAFLDVIDARTTRFIAARKKMIRLLEEKKQAVINQAVTKGLDPTIPMKDSGIKWLGEIPAHWEVRRLKRVVTSIDQGVSPQSEAGLADDNSWGVLKSGCVNGGVFRPEEHKRLPNAFQIDRNLQVGLGDVLVSRASGSKHFVGSTGQVESLGYQLILSDKTFRLNIKSQLCSRFVVRAMNSGYYRAQVESAISGAEGLANNLPLSELKNFVVVVPPFAEQECISERLDVETRELATAIGRYEREIELMQEYRPRLISDVVTGKLDLRSVALGELPEREMVPEDEPSAEASLLDPIEDDLAEAD